jgi:hypothetical protein
VDHLNNTEKDELFRNFTEHYPETDDGMQTLSNFDFNSMEPFEDLSGLLFDDSVTGWTRGLGPVM